MPRHNENIMVGAYLLFEKNLDGDSISTIVELGSRDGDDAIRLRDRLDARVVSFECNPEAVLRCESKLGPQQNIRFVPLGVWDENTTIPFYPVVNGNTGASSAFTANHDYPYETPYKQEEVEVEVVRLEDWWKENETVDIDLLCMDLQGSELKALQGAGDLLHSIDYIISEVQTKRLYHDTPLFSDIKDFLEPYGFVVKEMVPVNSWFGDALFVRPKT
tara:strand:- start:6085 stop:6738 length:654 start_codon:yes stop_codon:yes gene_type:complete